MALPNDEASVFPIAGNYISPDDLVSSPLEDFEQGGVAVQDTSEGLASYRWRLWYQDLGIWLQREGAAATSLGTAAGVTELSLAFDQNMRPHVAFAIAGQLNLRWFDSTSGTYVTQGFGPGRNPRLCLDDKRDFMISRSDVIFAYIRAGVLIYRQQRERFTVERSLRTGIADNIKLKNIGMNRNLRLQFELV